MDPNQPDDKAARINEIAALLDDAQIGVEELADEAPTAVDPATLGRLKDAIEDGRDAVEDLANDVVEDDHV